jgi:hypothetical protein
MTYCQDEAQRTTWLEVPMLASSHLILDLVGAIVAVVVVVAYFVPTIIAVVRKHHWIPRIFVVNVLLGWTVIGWIVAFHMASTSRTKTEGYWRPPVGGAGPTSSSVPRQLDETGKSPAITNPSPTFAPGSTSPTSTPSSPMWPQPATNVDTPPPSGTFGLPGREPDSGELA